MPNGRFLNIATGVVSGVRWGNRLQPLPSAAADADALGRFAAERSFETVTLADQRAHLAAVRAEIRAAAAMLRAGDTFVVAFNGHGLAGQRHGLYQQTWCLFDAPLMRFGDGGLDALLAAFAPGVRVLVIANCCHSGAPNGPTPPTPAISAHVIRLSACAVGESMRESHDQTVSPFVSHFIAVAERPHDFPRFFAELLATTDGASPQLEIHHPRDDSFLAAGPFRLTTPTAG